MGIVDKNIKLIYKKEPKKKEMAENFRKWLDNEIYDKKIPKKELEIKEKMKKATKESYNPIYEINEYDFISDEEFYELMELESMKYKNTTPISNIMESLTIYIIY